MHRKPIASKSKLEGKNWLRGKTGEVFFQESGNCEPKSEKFRSRTIGLPLKRGEKEEGGK